MKFGVHNPSWVYGPDATEIFDGIKAKAQWAENSGFVWFSVMDHLIQIGGVGVPTEPFMEGWTVLSALAAVHQPHPARHACLLGRLSQSRASGENFRWRRPDQPRAHDAWHRRGLVRR